MNSFWISLGSVAVRAACAMLTGEDAFDSLDGTDLESMESLPDIACDPSATEVAVPESPPTDFAAPSSNAWYLHAVDQANTDIAKIERGEWTMEDAARIDAQTNGLRGELAFFAGENHVMQAHNEAIVSDNIRSAQDSLLDASQLATSAELNYENTVLSGDRFAIDSSLNQMLSAQSSAQTAASYLDRLQGKS